MQKYLANIEETSGNSCQYGLMNRKKN